MDITKLVRSNILELKPYSSARDEFSGGASIFLDANESPYPTQYNRYPDPHQRKLKQRIGQLKKVNENQIFLGNGSDEAIDLLIRAFCEPGQDEIVIPQPTYGMYSVSASINNVITRAVSLTSDFDIDINKTLAALSSNTKLLFLCSPNNPSGNLLNYEKVIELIEKFDGLVVIDEAYIDFTSSSGFLPLLNKYTNLVILQTLSKAWGLAGLRLGMCFANVEIISILNKIKPPYNISVASQLIAEERLNDEEGKDSRVREIINQRDWLASELIKLKSVERVFPSDANFLLVRIKNAKETYISLLERGIVVRDRSTVLLCDDCLRISVGTPVENQKLLKELSQL